MGELPLNFHLPPTCQKQSSLLGESFSNDFLHRHSSLYFKTAQHGTWEISTSGGIRATAFEMQD